jgi:hypothetical protein
MITERWVKHTIIVLFVGTIGLSVAFPPIVKAIDIDPELIEQFKANETAGYVIYFRAKANLSGAPSANWKEQNEFINRALQENANRSQARVRSYLFGNKVPYRSVWKDNIIVVEKSDRSIFEGLLSFKEIEAIQKYNAKPKALSEVSPAKKEEPSMDNKP